MKSKHLFINNCFTVPDLPELTSILPKDSVDNLLAYQEQGESGTVLRPVFQALMTSDKGAIGKSLQSLLDRLEKAGLCDIISFQVCSDSN